MPFVYKPPPLFMRYENVEIYHAYKDDQANSMLFYWYTTDKQEDPSYQFDVRDVIPKLIGKPGVKLDWDCTETSAGQKRIIRAAIKHGILRLPTD